MKYLIVGLGNPGAAYVHTRHNVGFEVVEALAHRLQCCFSPARLGLVAQGSYKGRSLYLVKPSTYMNKSGEAVRYWLQALKVPLDHLLVVVDDLHLPLCKLRLRARGSHGGHNGMRHITALLGTSDYPRLRFGIGGDFAPSEQASYVLGKFTAAELLAVEGGVARAVELIASLCTRGLLSTMNDYNSD